MSPSLILTSSLSVFSWLVHTLRDCLDLRVYPWQAASFRGINPADFSKLLQQEIILNTRPPGRAVQRLSSLRQRPPDRGGGMAPPGNGRRQP